MEFKRFALAMVGHFLASLLYVLRRLRLIEPVVDSSSILEHREEIRDLWEKRMMADDNQSSPSSAVTEKATPKHIQEDGIEAEVVKTKTECETKSEHTLSNGFAKQPIENNNVGDTNANHIHAEKTKVPNGDVQTVVQHAETDHDNNNCADSLEEDNVEDYVEEKTYTSELETSLVVKQSTEEVKPTPEVVEDSIPAPVKEVVLEAAVSEPKAETEIVKTESQIVKPEPETVKQETETVKPEPETAKTESEKAVNESEVLLQTEELVIINTASEVSTSHVEEKPCLEEKLHTEDEIKQPSSEGVKVQEEVITSKVTEETHFERETVETTIKELQLKSLEIESSLNDEDDGFVCVEECLPKVDDAESLQNDVSADTEEQEIAIAESKTVITNGHDDISSPSPVTSTPEPTLDDKASHPEMEQFVKSGGVKRILPGVQKTEQPYSTCTTETKIAMEIREMREREEELRLMREQALLSPAMSPVPPKSPSARSPSPSMKDGASPTPSGCGYKVSSVFGHKGSTSPSPPVIPEEEKKIFKGFSKESAVEKEIRLARDREEELRKQKGLPPREDDSYVKPSQVKSSQVRVFGKMVGGNSSVKQAATAKIQLEIEEQTQREMALRETGHIQTISQERTDAKIAKIKTSETTAAPITNGNSHMVTNGNHTNERSSPDGAPYKRSSATPSPTGARPASIFPASNGVTASRPATIFPSTNGISMHKFISSKGKETTFSAPKNGVPFLTKDDNRSAVPPPMVQLKRNVSVESKIQQEILEMKQREEELKLLHMNKTNENSLLGDDSLEHEMNQKNNLMEYNNGNGIHDEDISPRHNKLIAQWEQRIQKAES